MKKIHSLNATGIYEREVVEADTSFLLMLLEELEPPSCKNQ